MIKNELEKEQLVKRLEAVSEALTAQTLNMVQQCLTTCIVCDHWNQGKEVCSLYNNQRPPAKVIAFGCPAFENEIPF